MQHIEVIKNSELKGNVLILPPGQLERKLYQDVAKTLENIGGKWNKKSGGFVWSSDPSELLEEIKTGVKRNLKQETQFFATPEDVAQWMVNELYYQSGMNVLEPSAGDGSLIDAFMKENGSKAGVELYYIEKDKSRNEILRNKYKGQTNFYHLHPDGDDFLNLKDRSFDCIIANPPFNKNQDIDHIRKMWEHLKPGGRIVSCASVHWQFASGKKEQAFKKWINDEVQAGVFPLDSGRFKKSGTMVSACILVIDKAS